MTKSATDPERGYYQNLADLLRIFWELHRIRVAEGAIPFAGSRDEAEGYIPFSFKAEIAKDNEAGFAQTNIIEAYTTQLFHMVSRSWEQFVRNDPVFGFEMVLKEPYIRKLIKTCQRQSKQFADLKPMNLENAIKPPIYSGIKIETQVAAIFGEEFRAITLLMASKIQLENFYFLRKEMGIHSQSFDVITPDTRSGLNLDLLKEFGYGVGKGCPAGMRPSPECLDFLKRMLPSIGGDPEVNGTMLEAFAMQLNHEFQTQIRDEFNALSGKEKQRSVSPENSLLLKGEVLAMRRVQQAPKEGSDFGHCPYHRR